MATQTLILLIATLGAVAAAGWRARSWLGPLAQARPAGRLDRPWQRLAGVLADIGLHRRLLRIRFSGVMHLMIFTSFLVLFTVIVQAFGAGFFPGFSLEPIGGHTWLATLQEAFMLIIAAALGMAIWHRFVRRPARFAGSNRRGCDDDLCPDRRHRRHHAPGMGRANRGGRRSVGAVPASLRRARRRSRWAGIARRCREERDGGLLLGSHRLDSRLPDLHSGVEASPHVRSRPEHLLPLAGAQGPAAPPPPVPDSEGRAGVVQGFGDFTWKDLLDGLSCTECGRCQAVCPAHGSGAALSPKRLVMDLRDGMTAPQEPGGTGGAPIAGGTISAETLWACTTCRACMEVCPLHIEHVPKIVQLRRSLVEEGEIEPMLQDSLTSLQTHGNSFGKSPKQRARWTRELSFKPKDARREAVDILWFVGDFASFDPRVQRLTLLIAELLARAEVDFGILYDGERNSGNDVRRVGDEGAVRSARPAQHRRARGLQLQSHPHRRPP